jgi:hypothetical protein
MHMRISAANGTGLRDLMARHQTVRGFAGRGRTVAHRRRSVLRWSGVVAVCVCLLAGGCRKGTDAGADFAVKCDVTPSPPTVGPATLTLTLTGAGQIPITGATVKVEGDMSHPGMAPVFGEASEVGPGIYTAPFRFSMAGDWVITIDATLPDGTKRRTQVDIRGVRSVQT